jgi:hypothetical protein
VVLIWMPGGRMGEASEATVRAEPAGELEPAAD